MSGVFWIIVEPEEFMVMACWVWAARASSTLWSHLTKRHCLRLFCLFWCSFPNLSHAFMLFLDRRGFLFATLPPKLYLFGLLLIVPPRIKKRNLLCILRDLTLGWRCWNAHLNAADQQTAQESAFIEVCTPADDQLTKRWSLAAPSHSVHSSILWRHRGDT